MANLATVTEDVLNTMYLRPIGPSGEIDWPQYRTILRETHRYLERQTMIPSIATATKDELFTRPNGVAPGDVWPQNIHIINNLGLRTVESIQRVVLGDFNVPTGDLLPVRFAWRLQGPVLYFYESLIPEGGDDVSLRFTGTRSLMIAAVDNAASVENLRAITDRQLPILSLESEIYQLALEYHVLEFLQDERTEAYFNELTAAVQDASSGTRTTRIIDTNQTGFYAGDLPGRI